MSLISNTLDKSLPYIEQIKILLEKYPHTYFLILNKNKNFKYLLDWINSQTPLLQDKFYKLSTKIYWILHNIKSFDDDQCKCKTCGKQFVHLNVNITAGYPRFCAGKNGNNCSQINNIVQEKSKQTCLKKYGVTSYTKTQECKIKTKNSFMTHYGVDNNMKCKEGLKEYTDAMIKRYGVMFCAQDKNICAKQQQTKLEKYGHKGIGNINKSKQTCIERYGYDNSMKVHAIRQKAHYKYNFNNKYFDSSPELAYYIWLKDNNIAFEYQPNCNFIYYVGNIKHKYFPDFYLINENQYVEIKGSQFFDVNGNPINAYTKKSWKDKYDFIMTNNIKLMLENEYVKYCKYCEDKFKSKNWYKQFKKSKNV